MVRSTRRVLNLAFVHYDWLPLPSGGSSAASLLRSTCEQAKVSKIGFLRHGKTGPKPDDGVDFDRLLTDVGRSQAAEAGSTFGRQLGPFFTKVLVSPAPRTVETARLFLEAAGQQRQCQIQSPQALYDGTMQPEGSALFQKIGYAPLSDYVNSENKDDAEVARRLLGLYSRTVVDAMQNLLQGHSFDGETGPTTTLWMVGHAIYLPAAALYVASLVGCKPEGTETILSCNTKEAEGFLIDLEKSQASSLSRPSSIQAIA
jgi:Histidine phosphatase superfamily (branch 1)